ncbi:hypothetical protein BC828DRAFT_351500 [Blastocladiella britannica]|nr:hypothetical protein BC828DRAFT_351500 [Blastocladiella britannica]
MYAFVARLLAGIRASVASLPPPPAATAAPSLTALSRAAADEAAYVAGPAFKDYAPRTFQAIRTASGVSEHDYLDSLTGQTVLAAVPSPGKSKATLYFSHDYKYILKTIKSAEKDALLRMLPEYAAHIVDSSAESLVAPGGLGTAHYPAGFSLRPTRHVYVVVMGNAFPPALDIHARYDLKGSTVGRGARDPTDPFTVRKDLDWVAARRRLAVGHTHAAALAVQMRRDAAFLARAGMMDYSLLVGVHDLRRGNDMAALASPSSVAGEGRLEVLAATCMPNSHWIQPGRKKETDQENANRTLPRVHAPGQMRSEDEAGQLGPELYFVSIIDILTPYNWTKRIEHVFKSVAHDSNAISAIRPDKYGKRFVAFMEKQVLRLSK